VAAVVVDKDPARQVQVALQVAVVDLMPHLVVRQRLLVKALLAVEEHSTVLAVAVAVALVR
jgi:hypothetical protein